MSDPLLAHAVSEGRLPDTCDVVLPGMPPDRNVGISGRGVKGVLLAELDFGDAHTARCIVRPLNLGRWNGAYHEHAMLVGSLLGWDMPLANPQFLMQHGKRFLALKRNAIGFSFP